MTRILPLLWLAFKVWMVVDAHKRRAPHFWYFIIMFVPFGGFAYLFMVKLKDVNTGQVRKMFEGPASVSTLRKRFQSSPSVANLIAFAQGLYDAGEHRESALRFEEALERDPDSHDALHGLGVACLQYDDFERGIPALVQLVQANPSYHDYLAWPDLALAFMENGEPDQAIEVARTLVKKSPRVKHKVLLGHVLKRADRDGEARDVLEEALIDHEDAASYVKRQNRIWVSEAKGLLKEIEQGSRSSA